MGRAPLKESLSPASVGKEKPSPYAYEHKITLNAADQTKLGLDEPKVGDVFHVEAHGHVTSVDQTESENGDKSHTVGIQLKKMAMKAKKGSGDSMLGAVNKGLADSKNSGE
jgi:hypothetical protein